MNRYIFLGIFLLIISCSSPPKRPSSDSAGKGKPDVLFEQKGQLVHPHQIAPFIVDELFEKKPNIQGLRIGVLNFTDAAGKISANGTRLAEKIISELTSRKSGTVVERENLKRILEEQKLNISGVATESGQEAGTVLGVDVLISGSISPVGEKNQITAKVTEVKTGEIYATVAFTAQEDASAKKNRKRESRRPPYKLKAVAGMTEGLPVGEKKFREEFERLRVRNPPGYQKIGKMLKRLKEIKKSDPETFMLITEPPGSQKIVRLQRENLPRFMRVKRIRKKVFAAIRHLPSFQQKLFLERRRVAKKLSQKNGDRSRKSNKKLRMK